MSHFLSATKMACRAIESWTLCSLVGSYLDLALAYLFLCASTLAFLASKFLSVFGLALPCSCNGLFGRQPRCLQGLLIDYPANKIAAVHMSLRSRFPFDCLRRPSSCLRYDVKFMTDDGGGGGGGGQRLSEMGGGEEESWASASYDPRSSKDLSLLSPTPAGGLESVPSPRRASLDVKGKGVLLGKRPPFVTRRRCRRRPPPSRRGKSPSAASPSPPLQLCWKGEGTPRTPFNINGQVQMFEEKGDGRYLFDECLGLVEGAASANECNFMEKNVSASAKEVGGSEENVTSVIRNLQRALKEEQSTHVALSLELEKERNAAATAADEAMAMILRLQREKAKIEMEARQYRNIVEEKSAYYEEEMMILKEIIVRREREKHVLEKEVKAYWQMMLDGGEQQSDSDLHDMTQLMGQRSCSSFDPLDDPIPILQQIYESIEKKEKVNTMFQQVGDSGPLVAERHSCATGFGSESVLLSLDENAGYSIHGYVKKDDSIERHQEEVSNIEGEGNIQFQEKGMVTMQNLCKLNRSQECGSDEVTSHLIDEDCTRVSEIEMSLPLDKSYRAGGQTSDQRDDGLSQFETEERTYDVHVIDDKINWDGEGDEKEIDLSKKGCASGTFGDSNMKNKLYGANSVYCTTSNSVSRWTNGELNIHRSCSDMTNGGKLMGSSFDKASWFDLRRHSVSAADYERYILENEVERLRKRLKIIQQGREQLSSSVERKEKESDSLLLLEEISHQLQEIRQVTEPEKNVHQASLIPISSKANLKKRRCCCVSRGLNDST
ncbi:uncharacterized protein LOC103718411 isoform X1 [Phoenix dactylifera]|uniref:Uncharacterized protein LOC103718411 isoform X1 n=2 Tax=Phoenix dactylifera TaxID=42345 RepID=A0A8B9AKS9_PHODC|nr:uncharacterized protein LOC103718411 isoform X1 [Phoenix dactylifera]